MTDPRMVNRYIIFADEEGVRVYEDPPITTMFSEAEYMALARAELVVDIPRGLIEVRQPDGIRHHYPGRYYTIDDEAIGAGDWAVPPTTYFWLGAGADG